MQKKLFVVLGLLLVAAFVLTACKPTEVIKTVEVEKIVEVEKTVEVEVEVEKVVVEKEYVEVGDEPFTVPHPILGDLRVRQAMAHCTDKAAIAMGAYPLLSREQAEGLVMHTFIPSDSWAYAGDENVTVYEYDVEKAGALLDEAGWTLGEGADYRSNAEGKELSLMFTTTSAAFRQAWAAVFESQMAECGIRIVRLHAPASWWFGDTTGLAVRDFELGAFAWVGQADPGGYTLWACEQIPLPSNNWAGQNYMGWCNPEASAAIKKAVNTLDQAERKAAYDTVQKAYTADVPALPLFNRTETFSAVANLVGFNPVPGQEYYNYNVQEWENGTDTLVVGFTQEPASLHTLVESAFVSNLAVQMIDPRSYTSLNYEFQPVTVDQLSTLENGLAVNNDLEVVAGDMVINTDGDVVELADGVEVNDAEGNPVVFDGTPITMKQLVVTYDWRDDMVWSDGVPFSQADLELGYAHTCDPDNGAVTFYTCERTLDVVFEGTNYTVTFVPGYQDALYFLAPFGYYPAHRVIGSGEYEGMTLAEVPASAWVTLAEIAENPIGVGPYMIEEWIKGDSITYVANPYYFGGEPKTPKLIIKFVSAENAEAQLLGGELDLLGSETLAGLTEQLVAAAERGEVVNYVEPGATWEHVDFNLYLP